MIDYNRGDYMRTKPGQKQVNWWLPDDLLVELKEYQYECRLDSLTEAARNLLKEGLKGWRQQQNHKRQGVDA
jgi:hypothetical protein